MPSWAFWWGIGWPEMRIGQVWVTWIWPGKKVYELLLCTNSIWFQAGGIIKCCSFFIIILKQREYILFLIWQAATVHVGKCLGKHVMCSLVHTDVWRRVLWPLKINRRGKNMLKRWHSMKRRPLRVSFVTFGYPHNVLRRYWHSWTFRLPESYIFTGWDSPRPRPSSFLTSPCVRRGEVSDRPQF